MFLHILEGILIKVVDIAWIADKSLDIYCSKISSKSVAESIDLQKAKYRHKAVAASVGKIFSSVFNEVMSDYSKKYDKVFVIVPCYPIMRMRQPSIISRFICRNDELLSEFGVSSNQFLEFFEKFIMNICKNEYITKIGEFENCYVLKGKNILFHDWIDSIVEHYGSYLVDCSKTEPFDSNPNFIMTMEYNIDIFLKTTNEIRFKTKSLLENLT